MPSEIVKAIMQRAYSQAERLEQAVMVSRLIIAAQDLVDSFDGEHVSEAKLQRLKDVLGENPKREFEKS